MTPEQQREQFIRGLNTMNQYNIRMMAKFYDTQDNITKALAEAEKYTLSQKSEPSSFPIFPSANPYIDTNRSGGGMTKNEIEDLIKTTMASSQPQTAQQNTDLQSSIKSLQETMSRVTKTLDNSKKLANKRGEDIIRRFLSELLRTKSNKQPEDDYNYDPVDDITDSMAGMTLNSTTINAINSTVKSAVKKKCTKCSRFGYTSQPDSDSSSSNTSSSDSSDSDSSSDDSSNSGGDITVNITKAKRSEEGE
ncbi:12652_t:CDS:2 [Rhizophagus irregularis]|nr:12652_t:CDS:2 [Rhizophagus irregularis]